MAASVRVENDAFDDIRFEMLGQRLGTNRFDALGRMIHVWRHCTKMQTHTMSREAVDLITGTARFTEMACEAGLLEVTQDARFRVKGTHGRIEWLQNLRNNGKKGGRPKKTRLEPDAKPGSNPPSPSPSPSPVLKERDPSPAARAREVLSEALEYLNRISGRRFEATQGRVVAVKRILGEGRRLEDIRVVFWSKCRGPKKWLGDEKMEQHVTPDTLLRKSNFQRYLEQARAELAKEKPSRAVELGYAEADGFVATEHATSLALALKADK